MSAINEVRRQHSCLKGVFTGEVVSDWPDNARGMRLYGTENIAPPADALVQSSRGEKVSRAARSGSPPRCAQTKTPAGFPTGVFYLLTFERRRVERSEEHTSELQ